MPATVKQGKRLIRFVQFFRPFIPKLGQKMLPFYNILRKDVEFKSTTEHHDALEFLKTDLWNATKTTLRLPKPGLQYVIFCDASFHGTVFVLMVEDFLSDRKGQEKKTFAPVSFGSRLFNTTQLKFSVYYKDFLRLWNCLDRVLSLNILLARIPWSAAHFLSRMQTDPRQSLSIKLTDQVPINEIEIETSAKSPDVALSNIDSLSPFSEILNDDIDEHFLYQLRECGLYEQFLEKHNPLFSSDLAINGFSSLVPVNHINLIDSGEFRDIRDDLPNRTGPLNSETFQIEDGTIREVIAWKN